MTKSKLTRDYEELLEERAQHATERAEEEAEIVAAQEALDEEAASVEVSFQPPSEDDEPNPDVPPWDSPEYELTPEGQEEESSDPSKRKIDTTSVVDPTKEK